MFPIDRSNDTANSFVIFGATGFLTYHVVLPHLFELYRKHQLPPNTRIYGFTRKKIDPRFYRVKVTQFFKYDKENEKRKCTNFWNLFKLHRGEYDKLADYATLAQEMHENETKHNITTANRIFYLAVPPIVFDVITLNTSRKLLSVTGSNRIVVEKPFARNDVTYRIYQTQLCQTFKESQIYMIDHYLGKDTVLNLLTLRFGNTIFNNTWDNKSIECVMITCKDTESVGRRGPCFDQHGIIRETMQNHMMQILSFIAMEQPYSADVEHIRDEKLKLLRSVAAVDQSDIILGQYVNNMRESDLCRVGYTEEKNIPPDSITPTYALAVLHIQNKRWNGVPFILRCGKRMNETKSEVRIQYKKLECDLFEGSGERNELVISIQPNESIMLRMMARVPGDQLMDTQCTTKTMTDKGFRQCKIHNYERLLLDIFAGTQLMFMRSDEMCEAWRIFSPALYRIEFENLKPLPYPVGSRGPLEAYEKAESYSFQFFNKKRPDSV